MRAARVNLEALLRARKLDNTLTSALPALTSFPNSSSSRPAPPPWTNVFTEACRAARSPRLSGRDRPAGPAFWLRCWPARPRGRDSGARRSAGHVRCRLGASLRRRAGAAVVIRARARGQWSVAGGQRSEVSGQWSVASGQGQRDAHALLATDHRPLTTASREEAAVEHAIKALNLVLQAGAQPGRAGSCRSAAYGCAAAAVHHLAAAAAGDRGKRDGVRPAGRRAGGEKRRGRDHCAASQWPEVSGQ